MQHRVSGPIRNWKSKLLVLTVLMIAVLILSLNVGYRPVELGNILAIIFSSIPGLGWLSGSPSEIDRAIILEVRLPRILAGALVGSALATAGTALQGIFRNPLAEPYITGVSAGAAVGGALTIVTGFGASILGRAALPVIAFAGSLLAVFLVYDVAKTAGRVHTMTLLLAGITISVILSAIVTLLIVLAGEELRSLIFWLLGSLAFVSWAELWVTLPLISLGILVVYIHAKDLNAISQSEETAQSLGVDLELVKRRLLISSSLVTASSVAIAGIIGFVGLLIPHLNRIILGPDHRILIPASALAGATFMVLSDAAARMLFRPVAGIGMELPVGVVTALVGGPFFIYLLRKGKGRYRF